MPPAQFPTPANASFPLEPVGPTFLKLLDHPPEYPAVTIHEFKDGGSSYGSGNVNAILRFEFWYDALDVTGGSAWDPTPLDSHWASTVGILFGFLFRHPRSGVLFTDCHYEIFERDHAQPGTWIQSCHLIIVKRPI